MPGGRDLVGHVMPRRSRGDRWTCTSAGGGPKKCIRELLLLLDHDFRSWVVGRFAYNGLVLLHMACGSADIQKMKELALISIYVFSSVSKKKKKDERVCEILSLNLF